MIRLFIALIIPDEVKSIVFDHCKSAYYRAHRNIDGKINHKIHLTLKFIGEVKEELLPQITERT